METEAAPQDGEERSDGHNTTWFHLPVGGRRRRAGQLDDHMIGSFILMTFHLQVQVSHATCGTIRPEVMMSYVFIFRIRTRHMLPCSVSQQLTLTPAPKLDLSHTLK